MAWSFDTIQHTSREPEGQRKETGNDDDVPIVRYLAAHLRSCADVYQLGCASTLLLRPAPQVRG